MNRIWSTLTSIGSNPRSLDPLHEPFKMPLPQLHNPVIQQYPFMANADRFIIPCICSSSNYNHLTVIRNQHMIGITQQIQVLYFFFILSSSLELLQVFRTTISYFHVKPNKERAISPSRLVHVFCPQCSHCIDNSLLLFFR